jgi:glycerol-3-phosphate acyltransferase PlsX
MDEKPAQALRGKPDSSMRVALELVRDGKVRPVSVPAIPGR